MLSEEETHRKICQKTCL